MEKLLEVKNLTKLFSVGYKKNLTAINSISFDIYQGETFGLIGESGSGKSTVGRCILNLLPPTDGELFYKGTEYTKAHRDQKKQIQKEMQMVFQDPNYSLNPRVTVWDTVYNTLRVNKQRTPEECQKMTKEALDMVHLKEGEYNKYAHQLSAGQQQRVGIARAIAARPNFIVLDEPTSSLDVSIRAEIIDLLRHLQETMGVSYLFISHDLSTIQYICHRVAVMYLGSIVEYGTVDQLFKHFAHPYSKALLASVMAPDPDIHRSDYKLSGEIPSAINLPKGCTLASRCSEAEPRCFESCPDMVEIEEGHYVKCFHAKSCHGCGGK